MRWSVRASAPALTALLCALVLMGCAAAMPSVPFGVSTPSFPALSEMPRRIEIHSGGIPNYDPAGAVLRDALPEFGFTIVQEDAEATLTAIIKYSDFSPVHLDLSLREHNTGTIIWRARVSREWDMYASVVTASESNAKKAMELFQHDLAAARMSK